MAAPDRDHPPTFDAAAYLESASRAVALPIPETCKPGVIANLERSWGFAKLLLDMPGLSDIEPAPVFRPGRER